MSIHDVELVVGQELPRSYKDLVAKIPNYSYISFNEFADDFPDDDGTDWFFWGETRLEAPVEMDGAGSARAFEQLKLFVTIDQQIRHRQAASSDESPIDLKRIAAGFCIAEDNGDLLYIDLSDDNSVWRYMHDSGEVKKLAPSFDQWLSRAKID